MSAREDETHKLELRYQENSAYDNLHRLPEKLRHEIVNRLLYDHIRHLEEDARQLIGDDEEADNM